MSSRNLRGFSGSTTTMPRSKYLGDLHDPHFTIVDRQKLSTLQEDELRRMCTLALANVPHSDDMTDNPFRYLSSQITTTTKAKIPKEQGTIQEKIVEPVIISEQTPHSEDCTATPSEISRRETFQTDATTPLTTPGETGKQFSDFGKRPVIASISNSRLAKPGCEGKVAYSFLADTYSTTRPFTGVSKSVTELPLSRQSQHNKHTDPDLFSRPEFNKSLPAIPNVSKQVSLDVAEVHDEKLRGFSRVFKTLRRTKTEVPPSAIPRSTSSNSNDMSRQRTILEASTKKRRFPLSFIFSKRSTVNMKRATVG